MISEQRKNLIKGLLELRLNPVPIEGGVGKAPIREDHNSAIAYDECLRYSFSNVGISTGVVSDNLEVLDFDLKNSSNPEKVWFNFKSRIPINLMNKLVIQSTPSGGYHIIYRCPIISSSKQLAKNKEGKAIIETRGEGGLIKCVPSKGYKLIQNKLSNIPTISAEDRESLFISAKMENCLMLEDSKDRIETVVLDGYNKFSSFNEEASNGLDLLQSSGWTILDKKENDEWYYLCKPDRQNKISAGYSKEGNFLWVFSTSAPPFSAEKPYKNHAIYAELVHEGRYDKAYSSLFSQGYGNEEENYETENFLSSPTEENNYLQKVMKDEIEEGLSTGWSHLDEFFRFKRNSFNVGLGFDNVGKSVLITNLMVASNVMHNWKWGIAAPENRTAVTRKRLIECESGRSLKTFSQEQLDMYSDRSRENFFIIENKTHYSIEEVLEKGEILYKKYNIDAFLIDPYNFFSVEGNGYSNDNNILSKIRVFAEKFCAVYVMAHTYTGTTRNNLDEFGYLKAPTKYDIQGGNNFANRVDDFFVVHRVVNHDDPVARRTMQFIVNKVKETETGGRVHPKGEFTELLWEEREGFLGYWDENGNNPMKRFLDKKKEMVTKVVSYEDAF